MVLPAVEPLDAVVELFEEARRRLVELFVDLAEEPAVRRLPSSVDELTDEGAVELGWLRGRLEALREQAFMFRNVKRNVQRDRGVLLAFEDGF